MKTHIKAFVSTASLLSLALASGTASAAIIPPGTGAVTVLPLPPPAATSAALVGMTAFAWDEQTNVPVTGLTVDMINPGPHTSAIPGTLSGLADSHILHLDRFGIPFAAGSLTFTQPIIGVIFLTSTLNATDGLLGATGTVYPTGVLMRDITPSPSSFFWSGNTLNFNLQNAAPDVMQIRVLTTVPTPGAATLAGLSGLAALRRRRR